MIERILLLEMNSKLIYIKICEKSSKKLFSIDDRIIDDRIIDGRIIFKKQKIKFPNAGTMMLLLLKSLWLVSGQVRMIQNIMYKLF